MKDPIGLASLTAPIEKGADFVHGMLARICYPAAEELGLMFFDRVSDWRRANARTLLAKADEKLTDRPKAMAQPWVVGQILEKGSWCSNETLQNMWAGLLASSCTDEGNDDSNQIYINLLQQITSLEARILNVLAEKPPDAITSEFVISGAHRLSIEELWKIAGTTNTSRINVEISHLRSLGLLTGLSEFDAGTQIATLWLSGLAFELYCRSQGSNLQAAIFFGRRENPDI